MLSYYSIIKKYLSEDLKSDIIAGFVVGLVALPLSIAFAIASGVNPEYGLYSAIIGGAIVALISGSRFQVSGPTGAFIIILLGIVNKYGFESLLIAGFLAGIILVLMGLFKFGEIIKYIPYPVIVGFTSGIGVIIFFGQIKDFLGLMFDHRPHGLVETIIQIKDAMGYGINYYSLMIGLMTLAVFYIWKKYVSKFPPAPIALLAGTIFSLLFYGKATTIGEIPSGLPGFQMLGLSIETIKILWIPALTIAILCAIESLLSAVVADGMAGTKHNSNKELIAQGIGNIITPFFSGIPVTGAIARTATNIKNGARTRMASFFHALTLLIIILFFSKFAKYIPLASLAAILMVIAYTMSETNRFIKLLKAPLADIFVLVITFTLTIFVDLSVAVIAGVILAGLLFIKRISEIQVSTLEDNKMAGSEGSKKLHDSVKDIPGLTLYEISGPLFFGATNKLQQRIIHNPNEILILRMKHVHLIDATAINELELLIDKVHNNHGKVILSTVQPKVRLLLEKHGIIDKIGGFSHITETSVQAIEKAKMILNVPRSYTQFYKLKD